MAAEAGEPADAREGSREEGSGDSEFLTVNMKTMVFMNARHYTVFNDKQGKIHGHSWQFQAEAAMPLEQDNFIKFEYLEGCLKRLLLPYQGTILNETPPFDAVEPLTENIAAFFFNSLERELAPYKIRLTGLTVWENPTKGIEITGRLPGFLSAAGSQNDEEAGQEAAAEDCGEEPADTEESRQEGGEDKPAPESPAGHAFFDSGGKRGPYPIRKYIIGVLLIAAVALLAYWPLLSGPAYRIYPWGSDTWGHLFKAGFLHEQLLKGDFFPQFAADWYNGCQPFRYWAPLPYYVLALIYHLTGNLFAAGNIFVFLCALLGGISCLLLARRIGFWPAVMLGMVWVVFPDNVRVALSEGNLPWVLATALLPLLFHSFFSVVERGNRLLPLLGTVLLIHMTVLCHAMIGAVYCICLFLFGVFLWIFGGSDLKGTIRGLWALALGVFSSAWWLLPSLHGGIAAMGKSASAGVQFVSPLLSFDPLLRFQNKEAFYWGIALLAVSLAALFFWRRKPAWAKSLTVTGWILVLLTFPAFSWLHQLLPLSHILWPLRFASFAVFALLAAALAFNSSYLAAVGEGGKKRLGVMALAAFVLLMADSCCSLKVLVDTRVLSPRIVQCADWIKNAPGWRVATLDLSMTGSAPSYLFSTRAGREQVFGWAWQGAVTSNNIMLLNSALKNGQYPFLFRELAHLGATDLVVLEEVLRNPGEFSALARQAGFTKQGTQEGVGYWNTAGGRPYLLEKQYRCLAIGQHASIYAQQYPAVEIGGSERIDNYGIEELKKYPLVILAGARWDIKTRAEEVIMDYVRSGGRVVIDFSGFPLDILARQPVFLGVYAEPAELRGQVTIQSARGNLALKPFTGEYPTWRAYIPQDLDESEMSLNYMGNDATVWGYKNMAGGRVCFVGANLAYHALLTNDLPARQALGQALNLSPGYEPEKAIPLNHYRATNDGYVFSYTSGHALEAILPAAALDGFKGMIDGRPAALGCFENLIEITLPAGTHQVELKMEKSRVYATGNKVSILAVFLLLLCAALPVIGRREAGGKKFPGKEAF